MPTNGDRGSDSNTPQNPPPPILPPVVERKGDTYGSGSEHESPKHQKTTKQPDHWSKGVEAVCAILLVVITGGYTYFAWHQWSEMSQQTHLLGCQLKQVAADSASSSVLLQGQLTALQANANATVQSSHNAQRAWMGFYKLSEDDNLNTPGGFFPVRKGTDARIALRIRNFGTSPALRVNAVINEKIYRGPFPKSPPYPRVHTAWGIEADSHTIYFPYTAYIEPFAKLNSPLTAEDMGCLNDQTCKLYLYGKVTYSDIFGISHFTHYCGIWRPGTREDFVSCNTYNETDNDNVTNTYVIGQQAVELQNAPLDPTCPAHP